MSQLVLSLFPGIGLLDMAFEQEGFCVVRGPDLLWGGDVRNFHPPAGRFDGVIGGPPCQLFSVGNRGPSANKDQDRNLIPEFERCVSQARPNWFLMENVRAAPLPVVYGYAVRDVLLENNRLGEVQRRERRFSFGTITGRSLSVQLAALWPTNREYTVLASEHKGQTFPGAHGRRRYMRGRPMWRRCELQGLPREFADALPFTEKAKSIVIGNGVPLPMGRAIARAVRQALGLPQHEATA